MSFHTMYPPHLHISTGNLTDSASPATATTTASPSIAPHQHPTSSSSHTSPHTLLTATLQSLLDIDQLVTELAAATNTVHQLAASSNVIAQQDLEAQRQVLGKSLVGIRGLVLDKLKEVETLVCELDQVITSSQDKDVDMTGDDTTEMQAAQQELQTLRKEWLDNSAVLRDIELDMHEFRNMVSVILSRIKEPLHVATSRAPPPPSA